MAKRNATSDLNHDNWNEEDTPEEAGTFQKASTDELKKRVIKTAKRRNPGLGNGSTKSAFAGFEGFKTAGSTPPAASFSFGLGSNSSSSSSNGMANETANPKTSPQSASLSSHKPITSTAPANKEETSTENPHSREYYAQLKGLNESVSAWIKSHVDKNPICILTPIFRDYERYLADIEDSEKEKKKDKASDGSTTNQTQTSSAQTNTTSSDKTFSFTLGPKFCTASTTSTTTTTTSTPSFFGSASSFKGSTKIDMPSSGIASGFVFGNKPEDSKDKSIKNEVNPFLSSTRENFNFGQAQSSLGGTSTSFPSAGFTFGGSSTFTFSSGAKTESKQEDDKATEKEEDEEDAPKDEFKPIVEDDALYTKRCKLFVKKEGKFNECGVGTLHIKPVPGGEDEDSKKKKIQVVVRADNAIGTVLLNVLFGGTSSLPTPTRVGRNNVMLVCPLPSESDNVPLPVLVRVKEEKDADELFSHLTDLD